VGEEAVRKTIAKFVQGMLRKGVEGFQKAVDRDQASLDALGTDPDPDALVFIVRIDSLWTDYGELSGREFQGPDLKATIEKAVASFIERAERKDMQARWHVLAKAGTEGRPFYLDKKHYRRPANAVVKKLCDIDPEFVHLV
jgi:hypothetical protein